MCEATESLRGAGSSLIAGVSFVNDHRPYRARLGWMNRPPHLTGTYTFSIGAIAPAAYRDGWVTNADAIWPILQRTYSSRTLEGAIATWECETDEYERLVDEGRVVVPRPQRVHLENVRKTSSARNPLGHITRLRAALLLDASIASSGSQCASAYKAVVHFIENNAEWFPVKPPLRDISLLAQAVERVVYRNQPVTIVVRTAALMKVLDCIPAILDESIRGQVIQYLTQTDSLVPLGEPVEPDNSVERRV